MRIVSQNRDLSVDFDRCEIWMQDNVVYRRIGIDSKVIGVYATPERAAEVFEDIHKAYSGIPILFQNVDISEDSSQKLEEWHLNGVIARLPDSPPKIETIGNSVYYMPEV